MNVRVLGLTFVILAPSAAARAQAPVTDLGIYLRQHYPSLAYVDRYRELYPEDVKQVDSVAAERVSFVARDVRELARGLVGLADQHVAIAGTKGGPSETLGILFRTSSDGHMVVWRAFEPSLLQDIQVGDEVIAIDGTPVAGWLSQTARLTFGGNARSRQAEAAFNLAAGSVVVHELAGLGRDVTLTIRRGADEAARTVRLNYLPMNEDRVRAMSVAVGRSDLPAVVTSGRQRIGVVRFGAFAPQYDPIFNAAADAAPDTPDQPDRSMLVGFCAVVRSFIAEYDKTAAKADLMVVDLRGNLGGFAREARLLVWAMTRRKPPRTLDVFASGAPGVVRLAIEPDDPSCGAVRARKPIVVLTDGGVRSAGEFMASWLWASGAVVMGERTVGAGGGFEYGAQGQAWGDSGYTVRVSGNFTVFDPTARLRAGDMAESEFVSLVSQDRFAPSRARPFAIQAVGFRPDLEATTTIDDLRDQGRAALHRGLDQARRRRMLH
jgi:C-terminal processing protease CtpA/Prc